MIRYYLKTCLNGGGGGQIFDHFHLYVIVNQIFFNVLRGLGLFFNFFVCFCYGFYCCCFISLFYSVIKGSIIFKECTYTVIIIMLFWHFDIKLMSCPSCLWIYFSLLLTGYDNTAQAMISSDFMYQAVQPNKKVKNASI